MSNHSEKLLRPTAAWREGHPQASVGILALGGVQNSSHHPELAARKAELTAGLQEKYAGMQRATLRTLPTLKAYAEYYKRFKKTYHVQLQLESIALKGKPFPQINSLVDAMFMAELDSLLLTAGHDLAHIQRPIRLDTAAGHEKYTRLQGNLETLKPGDMYMADQEGVISSIIYGPDQRTRIRPDTGQVLYTVYAPAGINPTAVTDHLIGLIDLVKLFAPGCSLVAMDVYRAQADPA
jgi:DNA/RNA-binding domain of Phe-tRNA-synthetase-like protein